MSDFSDVNMNGVEPQDDYAPIPVGDYTAAITSSEIKQTKDYTGKYIKLEVTILDGKYKGRKLWPMLNLWNKNEQTVSIAKRELASIKIATNQLNATNTAAFYAKPLTITVGIKPASGDFEASNNIKAWKPIVKPAPAAAPAAAPVSVAKPWEATNHDFF